MASTKRGFTVWRWRLKPSPFQFTLGRMLGLTLVCAVVAGIVVSWRLPAAWNVTLVLLAISAAAYVVLRLPYLCRELVRLAREWRQLRRRHAELNAQAVAQKEALRAAQRAVSERDAREGADAAD